MGQQWRVKYGRAALGSCRSEIEGARMTLRVSPILAAVFAVLAACGQPESEISGSYRFPVAYIGVDAKSELARRALEEMYREFALGEGLVYGSLGNYAPKWPRLREGVALEMLKVTKRCVLIAVYERSGVWRQRNEAIYWRLLTRLQTLEGIHASAVNRPKPAQNYPEYNAGAIDPEEFSSPREACARMGLEDGRTPEDNR